MSANTQPVLIVNLTDAKFKELKKHCKNKACENFGIESKNKFCSSCGVLHEEEELVRDMPIRDLFHSSPDSDLGFFQNTHRMTFNFNNYDDHHVHKDKSLDLYIYDNSQDNYVEQVGSDYIYISKKPSDEDLDAMMNQFLIHHNEMIKLLKHYNVKYELKTLTLCRK